MIQIGIAGIGFMGRIHFLAAQQLRGARVAAICSRDPAKRAGDWSSTRGNFGPPPGRVDLQGVRAFSHYADMLADPDLHLIDLCTVTDQHAAMAIQALEAGKHVLVEKPIALTLADADSMLAAARQYRRHLMVAHVLPFFPEFAYALATVRDGTYGRLLAANLTRVIAQPDWSAAIADHARTGGPAIDLHIHDTHFINLIAGPPRTVLASAAMKQGTAAFLQVIYSYGDSGPTLACTSGALAMPGRPFMHGFDLYLEHATLAFSSAGVPLTLFTADGHAETVRLPDGGDPLAAFKLELQSAVDQIASGAAHPALDPQAARHALAMCVAELESARRQEPVALEIHPFYPQAPECRQSASSP